MIVKEYERVSNRILNQFSGATRIKKKAVMIDGRYFAGVVPSKHQTPSGVRYRMFWRIKHNHFSKSFL